MCQSDPGANANARAVEVKPEEHEEECMEIRVGHVGVQQV